MHCPNCTNSWNPGDEAFPRCTTSPCPLNEYRHEWLKEENEKDSFRAPDTKDVNMNQTRHRGSVDFSIASFCDRYDKDTTEYDMEGAKSAKTTVTLRDGQKRIFKTKNQMHSEMVAIEKMIEEGYWGLLLGTAVWIDGHKITADQFQTTEPHCGFCTFFLSALNLPLTTPTYGRFQLASRLSYQLPVALEIDPRFLARVLDSGSYSGFHMIKRMLNGFVPLKSSDWVLKIESALIDDNGYALENPQQHQISWDVLLQGKREVLYAIWKNIFEVLFSRIYSEK